MVRPCGARGFVDLVDAVLHYCIRPLIGACAPGHHGYQRACDLILVYASNGLVGSPVFARVGKTDQSIVVSSLSQTSAGKRCWLSSSSCCAVPLFVPTTVPPSRPACADALSAGAVNAGRLACL